MIGNHSEEERLSAIAETMETLEKERICVLAEIGEKALPNLRENPAFQVLVARIDETETRIWEHKQEETTLRAEIERREKEERERREREEREYQAKYTCYTCKTINSDSSRFCEQCGTKLGETPKEYCITCGTVNQPSQKFCGECGTGLLT